MEREPDAKRARLSTEDVLREIYDLEDVYEDDGPMTTGSDDEFEDLQVEEQDSDHSESDAEYEECEVGPTPTPPVPEAPSTDPHPPSPTSPSSPAPSPSSPAPSPSSPAPFPSSPSSLAPLPSSLAPSPTSPAPSPSSPFSPAPSPPPPAPSHPSPAPSPPPSAPSHPSPAPSPPPPAPSHPSPAPMMWSSTLSPVHVNDFVENVGPTSDIPSSPSEVFELFFTSDLVEMIVEQSNMYAHQTLGEEKYREWEKITTEEMRAYFGFRILMGIVRLPATSLYWSRNPPLHQPSISDRISRDRFMEISRFLHFTDNTILSERGQPGYDRLGKVRPVLDYLLRRFLTAYRPHREQAIDEAMIPFQGRSGLKQFMPDKPTKRGIKVWCRADSHNGYLCELQIYTGAEPGRVEHNLGTRVVLDLACELGGKHYHLYFDNFFTSTSLLTTLDTQGVYGCGTARQSYKGFPVALKMKGKGKREQRRLGLQKR